MSSKTPLYQAHLDSKAKMVDFAGWEMPIHYGSQLNEHKVVRQSAGMFDVSHMTVVDVKGTQAKNYLQKLLANDVDKLQSIGKALYSCMLNKAGGVVDDLIVYFLGDTFYRVVINSATREKDMGWLNSVAAEFSDLTVTERAEMAMIAVQGPQAIDKVLSILDGQARQTAADLKRFSAADCGDYFIARTGYTGEDGFEIMLSADLAIDCWNKLLAAGVEPSGLGARDTLRLEAGMNLYGSDMNEKTSPLISGLGWTIAMKDDRDFIGKEALLAEKNSGITQQLCGLVLKDRGMLRDHLKVITNKGEGEITSGSFSPSLGVAIAFVRVPKGSEGDCQVENRGKLLAAKLVKLPFVREGKACVEL